MLLPKSQYILGISLKLAYGLWKIVDCRKHTQTRREVRGKKTLNWGSGRSKNKKCRVDSLRFSIYVPEL